LTIRKNNGPKRKPIKPYLTQTSATGNTEQTPFTNEQNEERMKKLAAFRPSQARKWGESIFKKAVENDAKAKVEEKATPKVAAKKPVQVQESDRVMRSAYPKDSGNPLDEFKMPKYAENMRRHVSDGRFNDMRSQGVVGLPPPSAFRKMEKSVTKTTDLLGILKTKPPIANRKFKGNFAGQTPDWSQKNPTQERDVESWAEERGRRGENREAGMPNDLDGSLRANKNKLKGAVTPVLPADFLKEGNGTGEGAGAGVATGSGGLAGGGTAHVSTNSGIFTTTFGGDRGKRKAGQTQKDHDIATMSFNKRGTDTSSQSVIVEKGKQRLDKALAPIYNRNVQMREGGSQVPPTDQKTPKPLERQVSHKGTKRANTWKNP
jgi:hypothetical protein